jgi:hypothetical protein
VRAQLTLSGDVPPAWHQSVEDVCVITVGEPTDAQLIRLSAEPADIVVARRSKGLSFSQFAQIVGGRVIVDPSRLGGSMINSFRRGRMGALITTGQGLATTDVDGTAYNDADDLFTILDRAAALGVTADMMIHVLMRASGQWSRIRDSLRAEIGPMSNRQDIIDAFGFLPAGAGKLLFDSLMIWTTDRISASAGKYTGFWWAPGALGYAIGSTGGVLANALLRDPGIPMVVSYLEKPGSATIEIFGNAYDGSGVLQEVGGLFKGKE